MILVVGATGLVGMETCRLLRAAGQRVRAIVRPTSAHDKVAELHRLGVETVVADLREHSTLGRTCQGVSVIVSTATATAATRRPGDTIAAVDLDGHLRLVDAAEEAGVRRFCYLSFRYRPEIPNPLGIAKATIEQRLTTSTMEHCILQASVFMEIWLSPAMGFDCAQHRARILGTGDQPVSYVAATDVAQFCAAAATSQTQRNLIIPVGGPRPQTPNDVVRIFEDVTRKKFTVERVPVEALRAQYESATDDMSRTFAGLALWFTLGDPVDMSGTRDHFSDIRLTSVRDYAERIVRGAAAVA